VCDIRNVPFDEHHVVPRAYGGEAGPQITLCGSHHQLIHTMGLCQLKQLTAHSDESTIDEAAEKSFQSLTDQGKQRATYLASVISKAGFAVVSDSNKTIKYSGELTAEQNRKINAIKLSLGVRSKHSAIVMCVNHMYKALFKDR
jgi:acyl CoA:acetate/3-ketoacid CoA transferase